MATIADVARRAGVAASTVSHVLNGTRFVSREATQAVREAVSAVGYTPNTLARALARSKTNTVGLAVSASTNRYFADVINAVEDECAKLGMMVLLANTHDRPEREHAVVAELHRRRVDGIILAPTGDATQSALDYLREAAIPAVLIDRLPASDFDGVGVENRNALGTMVHHLAAHGHRHIGFIGARPISRRPRSAPTGSAMAFAVRGSPSRNTASRSGMFHSTRHARPRSGCCPAPSPSPPSSAATI